MVRAGMALRALDLVEGQRQFDIEQAFREKQATFQREMQERGLENEALGLRLREEEERRLAAQQTQVLWTQGERQKAASFAADSLRTIDVRDPDALNKIYEVRSKVAHALDSEDMNSLFRPLETAAVEFTKANVLDNDGRRDFRVLRAQYPEDVPDKEILDTLFDSQKAKATIESVQKTAAEWGVAPPPLPKELAFEIEQQQFGAGVPGNRPQFKTIIYDRSAVEKWATEAWSSMNADKLSMNTSANNPQKVAFDLWKRQQEADIAQTKLENTKMERDMLPPMVPSASGNSLAPTQQSENILMNPSGDK